jgi:hypothetical protein
MTPRASFGRRHDSVADAMGAARGERAHAVRAGVGVRGIDIDVLTGTPSVSAQICRVTDFMPWPRSIDDSDTVNLPLGVGMNQRLAGVAAEVHADGIVDRGDAASAMSGHGQRLLVPKTERKRVAPCEATELRPRRRGRRCGRRWLDRHRRRTIVGGSLLRSRGALRSRLARRRRYRRPAAAAFLCATTSA